MTGTIINVSTVLVGSVVGVVLGERLPDRLRQTVIHAIGLMTLLIGFQMALGTKSAIILLGSLVIGGVLGESARIEDGLNALGRWVERRVATQGRGDAGTGRWRDGRRTDQDSGLRTQDSVLSPRPPIPGPQPLFSKGLVTASLLFCVGPMTILGSFQDGLTGVYDTLAVKSVLDGFTSIALASTLGWGVAFSAATVLIYQGALTLGAVWVKPFLTEPAIAEMTAAGGLLIVGIGLNILGIVRIRVGNMLPALAIAPGLVLLFGGR